MSWSINLIGKPENVAIALKNHSAKLNGESKEEFDDALPSMLSLVNKNFAKKYEQFIEFSANGHAYSLNGEQESSTCFISIKPVPAIVV